ncbi:MAG: ferredoxin [Acholeplasmatales bacterium]|nr:MAG: ferredoxin [Acholeplasmatales bacterium]
MPTITINNLEVRADAGMTILEAARAHNFKIPTLCHYPDLDIKSDCRICVVELIGQKGLVTACSTPVYEGMAVKINSPRALNARKAITEMILANHDAECTACVRNMNCELQRLAESTGIVKNRFESILEVKPVDKSNPSLVRNSNRCIKCGRCIDACKTIQGIGVLDIAGRGHDSDVTTAFGKALADVFCTYCGQCSAVCPVGAIMEKDSTDVVWEAIDHPDKHVIVQVAPAIRVSLGEELGLALGSIVTGKIVAALKMLGFSKVFDTNFTADLTIIEEGHELINRMKNGGKLPLITSCCPGWVRYAEHQYPDLLDNLSTCKSPQQMFGALAKTYYAQRENLNPKDIFVVSIMPCTAKKYEASRPEMSYNGQDPDVDAVLTTRELAKMIKQMGIEFENLREQKFDKPDEVTTGAAAIFGATGGVMEAALRSVKEILDERPLEQLEFDRVRGYEGIREAEVTIKGETVKVAVAHTLSQAKKIADDIRLGTSPYAFIEVMACPGGCVGGGGQPYGTTHEKSRERIQTIYQVDRLMKVRKSHDNAAVANLYSNYLGEPSGKLAHTLLHTKYTPR